MYTLGTKLSGQFEEIPSDMLTDSVEGQIYELHIATSRVTNPEEVARVLLEKLPAKFHGLKIRYLEIGENNIVTQIEETGSPFAWAALLAFLPEILQLVGIAVFAVYIMLAVAFAPAWVGVVGVLGVGVAVAGFLIGVSRTGEIQRRLGELQRMVTKIERK